MVGAKLPNAWDISAPHRLKAMCVGDPTGCRDVLHELITQNGNEQCMNSVFERFNHANHLHIGDITSS